MTLSGHMFFRCWLLGLVLVVAGCSDDDDEGSAETVIHEVPLRVSNLTSAQPMSAPVVVIHKADFAPWAVGESATVGMEFLAETGRGELLVSELKEQPQVIDAFMMTHAIEPGETLRQSIDWPQMPDLKLSVVSKLMATNDGVAMGTRIVPMVIDENNRAFVLRAYDTGTEFNTESAETLPVSIDGGEVGQGYNAARAGDQLTAHPGVVSADGGLASSSLDSRYRFTNPVGDAKLECSNCHQ
ncbi:Uncharacterised protein [BD1-7 clade bacterium]|uniref:Uncharacterized protein n=1 Tax=BD1-7 clade bacterium TaxID=2029982 RepID=A0A5S9QQ38_9GAMM|nr:Uncharacterised protein [BD1-7 clade bacterium]